MLFWTIFNPTQKWPGCGLSTLRSYAKGVSHANDR